MADVRLLFQSIIRSLPMHKICNYCIVAMIILLCFFSNAAIAKSPFPPYNANEGLVLYYTFDKINANVVKDLSPFHNDGKLIGNVKFLSNYAGRKGILRFDGENSYIDCGKHESLDIAGDMTIEMWIRMNATPQKPGSYIFTEGNNQSFVFGWSGYGSVVFHYRHFDPRYGMDFLPIPVTRQIFSNQWTHVAVVVEYPRCKFYRNGQLIEDAFMPVPGIDRLRNYKKMIGGAGRKNGCPMDLDEIRIYKRALTDEEIYAHYEGKNIVPKPETTLAAEPDWYKKIITLRLTCKGADFTDCQATLGLINLETSQPIQYKSDYLTEAFTGSKRFIATLQIPLTEQLKDKQLQAVAKIYTPTMALAKTISRKFTLKKPTWIHTHEGYTDKVLPPWTPLVVKHIDNKKISINVWGRQYQFDGTIFPSKIFTQRENILAKPITLRGNSSEGVVSYNSIVYKIIKSTPTILEFISKGQNDFSVFTVKTHCEYDGYIIFDCTLRALKKFTLNDMAIEIPIKSRFATLCYGNKVFPMKPGKPISAIFSGAVRGRKLAFRFAPTIWLGNEQRGLCWQAESDKDWHYSDPQEAIDILPSNDVTIFRANLINLPTTFDKGDIRKYKFALSATPIKPIVRDAWDLRVIRSEPYGRDYDLPQRKTKNGKLVLEQLHELGVKYLFVNFCDVWPHPRPLHKQYSIYLHRLVKAVHEHNLKLYNYMIHLRYPTNVPEFNIYGLNIANLPIKGYVRACYLVHNHPRPGQISIDYGADSQGTIIMCAKSPAMQDSYIYALAKRIDTYGEDGVYLDGMPIGECKNIYHGCGYYNPDGTIHSTYPVFANREFMKRIYTVLKTRNPNSVIDLHDSFSYSIPSVAYSDLIWSGEIWYHLRGKGAKFIPDELTLDKFRTEFMGIQAGVAANVLAYRLGPQEKVAAVSLLHDIPVRPNNRNYDVLSHKQLTENYFNMMIKLWKMRDEFDAKHAKKIYYWQPQQRQYISVNPDKCYVLLFYHPGASVLVYVTNLNKHKRNVNVTLNLDKLNLAGKTLVAYNVLDEKTVPLNNGAFSLTLNSLEWKYIWIKPRQ